MAVKTRLPWLGQWSNDEFKILFWWMLGKVAKFGVYSLDGFEVINFF